MAVQNTLAPKKEAKKNEIVFTANGSEVRLTPETVKNYLVSGDKDRVTMQEVVMFMNLCKFNGLNPWLREAYLIKYGTEPATIVASKEAFTKRAEGNINFNGYEAGIIVLNDETGEFVYRKGSFKLPGEAIVGGYAEVYRKDRDHSYRIEVSFDEYAGRKKDGTLNRQWASKPATMIRKVALVQALREAFPGTFGNMYSAEEQGVDEPIDVPYTEQPQQEAQQNEQTQTPVEEQYEQQSFAQTGAADALFGEQQ